MPDMLEVCPGLLILPRLGISPDPYLSGALAFETVQGVQSTGVITSTKVRTYIASVWSTSN